MTESPRPLTQQEVQEQFMGMLAAQVHYWAKETSVTSVEERLEGLAFSFLNMLDGTSGLPAFEVVPSPHPDNKAYHQEQGENWWPESPLPEDAVTVHGPDMLHDLWYARYAPFGRRRSG